jgi:hypothetical protein
MTTANRAFFAIKHTEVRDMWMIDEGNLQSQIGAIIFETSEDAQRFLDTRRLRRGFRAKLVVAEVSVETIRALAKMAREFSAEPATQYNDGRPYWTARAEYLEAFLPLAA